MLRLEDTDTVRNVEGGEALIYEALDWLGLVPDEGPREGGPGRVGVSSTLGSSSTGSGGLGASISFSMSGFFTRVTVILSCCFLSFWSAMASGR